MRILNPAIHGVLDYVFVVALALAPIAAGLSGLAAAILYLVAAAYLVTTLITAFPLGSIKVLPFATHQAIELVLGTGLLICPWIFGFASNSSALAVYIVSGFTLLLLRVLTKPV